MPEEAKFVSCKPGALVSRYGTRSHIGATVNLATGESTFNADEVVKIPLGEWSSYLKEYTRCVNAGVLIVRTEAAYEAWLAAQAAASEAEAKAAKAAEETAVAAAEKSKEKGK
jgi:hypothetical protein